MKFLALGLAALMTASAPISADHAFKGENADSTRKFERPAVCEKADRSFGAFRFDGERAAEWREKAADGEIDLSKCKPGNFSGRRLGGMKDKMPELPENFKPGKAMLEGKDIEGIKEKFESLTEEEKAAIKEKVQSFSGEKKLAGKFGRGGMEKARPMLGENKQ